MTPHTRTHTDAQALDQITEILNTRGWDITTLAAVATAVRATGRVINEVDLSDEMAKLQTIMEALRKHIKIEPE
jgi:hypothetical protein